MHKGYTTGLDLSGYIDSAPHGKDVLKGLTIVGGLE